MNLVKELTRVAKANYNAQLKEAQSALDSVKANLKMEDSKDLEMLSLFGTSAVVHNQKQNIQQVKTMVEGEWLTYDDIKNVCLKYHLRFLRSEFYKKEIPQKALNDLRKYKEENEISDQSLKQSLFVIAPASHFILGPRPSKDPVLIHQRGKNCKIVSTWGNDFTIFRRLVGFFYMYKKPMVMLLILLPLVGFITSMGILNTPKWFFSFAFLLFLIPISIEMDYNSSEEYWNKPRIS